MTGSKCSWQFMGLCNYRLNDVVEEMKSHAFSEAKGHGVAVVREALQSKWDLI